MGIQLNGTSGTDVISAVDGSLTVEGLTISGDFNIADKIIHSGDTNTAIRFPAADTIAAETAGSERLRIDSDGHVRVGSGDPTYEFELVGAGSQHILIGSTDASAATLVLDGDSNGDGTGSDYATIMHSTAGNLEYHNRKTADHIFKIGTSNEEKLRITSDGAIQSHYNPSLPVTDSRPILQLGYGVVGDDSAGRNNVSTNAYPVNGNATWHYIGSSSLAASRYDCGFGEHKWFTAAAGTRGNDITWSEKLRIQSDGTVYFRGSSSSDSHRLQVRVNDTDTEFRGSSSSGTNKGFAFYSSNTNGSEKVRIGSDGTVTLQAEDLVFGTTGKGIEFPNSVSLKQNVSNLYANLASGNNNIEFQSNGNSFVKFRGTNGNVEIVDGDLVISTAGHGIDFSAQTQSSATTGSELLNHYEEGTFTPYIDREHNSPIVGYDAQDGYYTRIGRVVYFYAEVRINSYNGNGSYGNTFLRGLPFNSASRTSGRGNWDTVIYHSYFRDMTTTDGERDIAVVQPVSEKVVFYIQRSENSWTAPPAPDANDQFKIGGYYFV